MTFTLHILVLAVTASQVYGSQIYMTMYPKVVTPPISFELYIDCNLLENSVVSGSSQKRDVEKTEDDVITVKNIIITKNGYQRIAHVSQIKPPEPLMDIPGMSVKGEHGRYLGVVINNPSRDVAGVYSCEIDAVDVDGKDIHFSKRDTVTVKEPQLDEVITEMSYLHYQFEQRPVDRTQTGTGQCGSSKNWAPGPSDREDLNNPRYTTVEGTFETSFFRKPVFSASFTGADALTGSGALRVSLNVREVTPSGFKVECITWMGAQVEDLEFSWTAYTAPPS